MSFDYPTIVDKVEAGEVTVEGMERLGVDRETAASTAKELVEQLGSYEFEVGESRGLIVVTVRLRSYRILIVPLGVRRVLSGSDSMRVFEAVRELIGEGGRAILVYYTPGGRLLTSAYLFLGHLIEKHGIGILFVNGGPDEVLDVLNNLREKGEFTPREEDYVRIMR